MITAQYLHSSEGIKSGRNWYSKIKSAEADGIIKHTRHSPIITRRTKGK